MNLDTYLYGVRIGELRPAVTGGYCLAYDPEPLEALGPGEAVLSSSLPARAEPYSHESTAAYVDGLLPQGERRRRLAAELGVDADDGFALIAEIGRDCPGAVAFLPEDEPMSPADPDSIAWLERRGTGRSGAGAAAAPLRPRGRAADALRAARRAPQARPAPRRAQRSLGLAGARPSQHPRGQARKRRAARNGRQRAVLLARRRGGPAAGHRDRGGDDRRAALLRLEALRPPHRERRDGDVPPGELRAGARLPAGRGGRWSRGPRPRRRLRPAARHRRSRRSDLRARRRLLQLPARQRRLARRELLAALLPGRDADRPLVGHRLDRRLRRHRAQPG